MTQALNPEENESAAVYCIPCDLDWNADDCPSGNEGHICPICRQYIKGQQGKEDIDCGI